MPGYRGFSLAVIGAAFALSAIALGGHAVPTARLYFSYPTWSTRAIDVRLFPERYRLTILQDFLSRRIAQAAGRRPVVILGDSQFFGTGQDEKDTFAAFMAQRNPDVFPINLAIVDGRFNDAMLLAERAARAGAHALVYNVNLWHFARAENPEFQRLAPYRNFFRPFIFEASTRRIIADYLAAGTRRQDYVRAAERPDALDLDRTGSHMLKFQQTLVAIKQLGVPVVVVMSPQAVSEFPGYGYDAGAFQEGIDGLMGVCRAAQLVCVDLTAAFDRSAFHGLNHLNTHGHRLLAERLAPVVANAMREWKN